MVRRNQRRSAEDGLKAAEQRAVEQRLAGFAAPEPSAAATDALIASLRPAVRANRQEALGEALRAVAAVDDDDRDAVMVSWIRLALAQVSLLRPPFWIATLLVTLLGVAVQYSLEAPAFVIFAPALAALGVAYAFRPALTGTWEMEFACPIRPFEWLMVRFGVVVAYDLALLGLATPAFGGGSGGVIAWRLILLWLGPLLFLCGVALQASLRWGAMAGTMLPLLCWGGLLAVATALIPGLSVGQPSLPLLTEGIAPALWAASLLAGTLMIAQAPRALRGWGGAGADA